MHQISLLGGLGYEQHPDSAHYLRPDRVYRTSVLSPMTGYDPGQAVQAIAADFTLGPYSGMTLSGLGRVGLFPRVRMWWQGVKARAAARRGQGVPFVAVAAQSAQVPTASEKQVHAPGQSLPPTARGNAYGLLKHGGNSSPMYSTGQYVGPISRDLPQSMVYASYGQSPALPPFASEAASKTTMMMWRGLRWPWG